MKLKRILSGLLLGLVTFAHGQSTASGGSVYTGPNFWQVLPFLIGGPLTYNARTDAAVFGPPGVYGELLPGGCSSQSNTGPHPTPYEVCIANAYNSAYDSSPGHQGAKLSYTGSPTVAPPAAGTVSGTNINGLNSYLNGMNTSITDPDFGTVMIRATDASLNSNPNIHCLGGGNFGSVFDMGSTGNVRLWAPDESKLMIWPNSKPLTMLAFQNNTVSPTNICGGYLPGPTTFGGANPHAVYTITDDKENTVPFTGLTGDFLTGEFIRNGGKTATLLAINPSSNFAQISQVPNSGSYSGNVWTGLSSGAHFTAVANPPTGGDSTPYSNAIYKGVICDGTTTDSDENVVCLLNPNTQTSPACTGNDSRPLCWYIQWELLFQFNYLPAMAGDPHFPTLQNSCIPQNYGASAGVFVGSDDDNSFSVALRDNGQVAYTGQMGTGQNCPGKLGAGQPDGVANDTHVCTGPVYVAEWRRGSGCRVFNSMTDQLVGDFGPQGTIYNGQANDIAIASFNLTQTPGDIYLQDSTHAETQLTCMLDVNNQCVSSGWTHAFVGLIYRKGGVAPDNISAWRDCGIAGTSCGTTGLTHYFTPSATPTPSVFYYPDVLHDAMQPPSNAVSHFSMVQQPDMVVLGVCNNGGTQTCTNTTGANQTVITYSTAKTPTYSPGQVFLFLGLAGSADSYLNCNLAANQCPTWTAVAGGDGSVGYIVISDTVGTGYSISDTGTMTPSGQQFGVGGYRGENEWINQTATVHPSIVFGGHGAVGAVYKFLGGNYQAISQLNPSTPATDDGTPNGKVYGPDVNVADAQTPPAPRNYIQLLPYPPITDQHGSYGAHGVNDYTPPILVTTQVCGQAAKGVGGFACPPVVTSLWYAEIIGIENWTTRSSPGNLVGGDCNYGAGPGPCVYRLGHTFNSNTSWAFGAQNAIGNESPLGNYVAFPSDWNMTLGCIDGTTNCWSSWEATAPTATSNTVVTWTTDGASPNPNVTVTMPNSFCPTGGTQYYWVNSGIQSISCGTRAGTVTIAGFKASETWINNQTLTLGPNTANNWQCDSTDSNAGVCNKFVLASVPGAPPNSSGTETWTSGTKCTNGLICATPTACNSGTACPRTDVWIARITTAHQ